MTPEIPGVATNELRAHEDERGGLVEILRISAFSHGFAQANHTRSAKGVLRGLHYHLKQADLWYVVKGRVQVGLADLRNKIETPSVQTHILDASEPRTLFIPPGVAHGYLALSEAELIYFVTHEYDSSDEFGVAWNDPTLSIPWQTEEPVLSPRDATNPTLKWDHIPAFS